jgi:creatinine amidohydrolase
MHQPGTIAYSARLQLELLQETVAEMARNGCAKVVIVNGHGGNINLTRYFTQTQIDKPKDYVVYAIMGGGRSDNPPQEAAASKPGFNERRQCLTGRSQALRLGSWRMYTRHGTPARVRG